MFEKSLPGLLLVFGSPSSRPTIHRELKVKRPPLSDPKHLDPWQRLALQPFEERPAGGRDIGEPPGRAGGIERRDRVTAACHRNNLPGGGEFPSATSTVPMSKGSSSKAPNGPFQTSVLLRANTEITCSIVRGPMSRIMSPAPT